MGLAAPHIPGAIKGASLVGQGGHGALPAAALDANEIIAVDHCISHKHFVEGRVTIHLGQLPHFDPGLFHVDDEVGKTLVLWCIPICAGQQQTVLSVMGTGVPDFLTIHDPFVAAQICPSGRAGQIGSTARFAK